MRELAHFAERVVLGVHGGTPSAPQPAGAGSLPERVERFEAQLIRDALAINHGDIKSTLEALGIPRKTFYDKLQRHGIDRQEYTGGAIAAPPRPAQPAPAGSAGLPGVAPSSRIRPKSPAS